MTIKIRKLAPDDSGAYRQIRLESLKAHPESFGSAYEEQNKLPKLMFEKAIEQPVDQRFVIGAFDQDELIGICGFVPFVLDDALGLNRAGTIIQMYVRSAYSGQKIGLKLTRAVVREAFSSSDIDHIVLGVRKANIPAIRVYQQAGFQPYSSDKAEAQAGNDDFEMMIVQKKREYENG